MPKWFFTDQHVVHYKNNHQEIFCVEVIFENFGVFLITRAAYWIFFADELVNDHALRNEQKCFLWRYVFFCRQTNKLPIFPKANRIVHRRVFRAIFFKPRMKIFEFLLRLHFICNFLINNWKSVNILLRTLWNLRSGHSVDPKPQVCIDYS